MLKLNISNKPEDTDSTATVSSMLNRLPGAKESNLSIKLREDPFLPNLFHRLKRVLWKRLKKEFFWVIQSPIFKSHSLMEVTMMLTRQILPLKLPDQWPFMMRLNKPVLP